MGNDFSRALIEGIVRRTLRNIKDSPERSIRNLIDMALNFSEGQFQRSFFESAQDTLRNENGAYYSLIRDMATTIDPDRLLSFGMNLGYNSYTAGSRTIREIEEREGYNIPWSITLELDASNYTQHTDVYQKLITEGKNLGIYTWLLISQGECVDFLELIEKHPDCAFLLFCSPEAITQSLLDEADPLHNLMFVVRYEPDAAWVCNNLRQREHLYSIYIPYHARDIDQIADDDTLYTVENLHPVFTYFTPAEPCSEEQQASVYEKILQARSSHQYKTIPVDLVCDNRMIDAVISDDVCEATFKKDGTIYAFHTKADPSCNLFHCHLEDILKHTFPKTKSSAT